jgi:hypothetical protein
MVISFAGHGGNVESIASIRRNETDFATAPTLVDGPLALELTAEGCDLEYWLHNVVEGTLRGQVHGHPRDSKVPEHMLRPGPLRQACLEEFAFRTISEEMGARAISHLVRTAPDWATMDFYSTQLLDEVRHAAVFRHHMVELGIPQSELETTIEDLAGEKRQSVLVPLAKFCTAMANGGDDFIVGAAMLTVIVEGVLAPAAELSERKWRVLDPPASEVARGANIDEIRHLAVGSRVIRDHLLKHPDEKPRLMDAVKKGLDLWRSGDLPIVQLLFRREVFFQEGMHECASVLGDYQLIPGRKLLDTTVEERLGIQLNWSKDMQAARMAYMGLT